MAVIVPVSTQNDYDLTGAQLVMDDTITNAGVYQLYIGVGNGVKDAAETAGTWELFMSVGGQISEPYPQYLPASTASRKLFFSRQFPSRGGGEAIKVYLKSPNGPDTDVNVDCRLYEVTGALPGKAADGAGGLPISDAGGLDMDAISTNVGAIQTILTGITSLANWLRALARSSEADATAKTEINTGGGTYDEATDSLEVGAGGAPSAATIVSTLLGDVTIGAAGTATFAEILRDVWAAARGKYTLSESGETMTVIYKDDDDSTTVFTLTATKTGRTVA